MATQWRVGMSGPVGLDYAVLPTVLGLERVPRRDWPGLFHSVRVMEAAAISEMRSADKVE